MRQRIARRQGQSALAAMAATCVVLAGCITVTNTHSEYTERIASVPAVPGLLTGIRQQTTDGKASVHQVLVYRGKTVLLGASTEPDDDHKECQRQGNAALDCAGRLVLWGWALRHARDTLGPKETEQARGWRFATAGYRRLTDDLRAAARGPAAAETWRRHSTYVAATLTEREFFPKPPRDYQLAQLDYGLLFWSGLPRTTNDLASFELMFDATEAVKGWLADLLDDAAPPLDPGYVEPVLAFWDAAFEFHQRPAPAIADPPRRLEALLSDGITITGVGYAVWPADSRLTPRRVLATTDLVYAERALRKFDASKMLDRAVAQRRMDDLAGKNIAAREVELAATLKRAEQAGDLQRAYTVRLRLADLYVDVGRRADAQGQLERTLPFLQATGQRREWVQVMVGIAAARFAAEDWAGTLELLSRVRPAMREGPGIAMYPRARAMEVKAGEKLRRVPAEDPLVVAASRSLAQLVAEFDAAAQLAEPAQRIARVKALLNRPGTSDYERVLVDIVLFKLTFEERRLDEAAEVLTRRRATLAALLGREQEAAWMGNLLELQQQKGDLGLFEATLRDYRRLRTEIAGPDWRGHKARLLAEVAFALQDFQGSKDHLQWQRDNDWVERLEGGLMTGVVDANGDDPHDTLLMARIELARGDREASQKLLAAVAPVARIPVGEMNMGALNASLILSCDLAEMEFAIGKIASARERLNNVLGRIEPLGNLPLWMRAALLSARNGLRSGDNVDALARRFEAMAPQLLEFRDLNAQAGVDMDLFLAEYHAGAKRFAQAMSHAGRAFASASAIGSLDQQIVAHRLVGELRSAAGDLPGAIDSFRRSTALLKKVSREIPSDVRKVGYRAERSKAIPLLIAALRQRHRETGDRRLLDQALEAAEQGKAQALSEMLFDRDSRRADFSASAARAALPPDTAVISFYLAEGDGSKLSRAVLDASGVRFDDTRLDASQLEARVRPLVEMLAKPHQYDEGKFRTDAAALAAELLPPEWLRFGALPYRRVYIVPTGVLNLLPFGALVDADKRFLDEAPVLVSYLPSLSSLFIAPAARPRSQRAAAFVNPSLEADHRDTLRALPQLRQRFTQAFSRWSGSAVHWETPWTRDDFAREAPALENVFLFSHARFLPSDPLNSYVRLSGPTGKKEYLTATDIMHSRLGNGLWVLAACSTGAGKVRPGDEVLGLPRALLEAGARGVLISLWDVDTASSLELMSHFYEQLADGASIAVALKTGTAALRAQGKGPYDWAPFVLIGHHDFGRP